MRQKSETMRIKKEKERELKDLPGANIFFRAMSNKNSAIQRRTTSIMR